MKILAMALAAELLTKETADAAATKGGAFEHLLGLPYEEVHFATATALQAAKVRLVEEHGEGGEWSEEEAILVGFLCGVELGIVAERMRDA